MDLWHESRDVGSDWVLGLVAAGDGDNHGDRRHCCPYARTTALRLCAGKSRSRAGIQTYGLSSPAIVLFRFALVEPAHGAVFVVGGRHRGGRVVPRYGVVFSRRRSHGTAQIPGLVVDARLGLPGLSA